MKPRVLVDTGPIVAIFHSGDRAHRACVEQLSELGAPLLTCWPVITEAAWLLRGRPAAVRALLGALDGSVFQPLELGDGSARAIREIFERYEDLEPQLAGAALVHLAERERIRTIFTLDRRDFSVYRTGAGRAFEILPKG